MLTARFAILRMILHLYFFLSLNDKKKFIKSGRIDLKEKLRGKKKRKSRERLIMVDSR